MSNAVRRSKVIDLRKRKPGPAQETRRTIRLEWPAHRKSSLRTRHRKLQTLLALAVLSIGVGAVYGLSVLSYLPQFAIQEVSVEGAENIAPPLIKAFIDTKLNDGSYHLLSRENIFLYPKAAIAKSISEYFPRILNAHISRESLLAQAITVTVVEREPFARWCSQTGTCFDMDNGGFVFAPLEVSPQEGLHAVAGPLTGFAQSSTSTSGEVVFTGGLATSTTPIGQTFLPNQFVGVLAFLSRLNDAGFSATDVSVLNEQDFAVSLSKGFVLRASFGADAATLVRNLQTVLSSDSLREKEGKIEYIDLRFGNRVYYKTR